VTNNFQKKKFCVEKRKKFDEKKFGTEKFQNSWKKFKRKNLHPKSKLKSLNFFKKNILLFCVSTPTYLKYEVRALMCLLC